MRSVSGRSAARTLTLTPMPSATACGRPTGVSSSAITPASFAPPITTSFGQRTCARTGSDSATAIAATSVSGASDSGGVCGRSSRELSRHVPGGAIHERPWRPRPADWNSVTARKPSGAPAAAAPRTMSWVDGQSGRSDASWPKRWLVAGAADSATWLQ